jgi:hypothetical protein
VVGGFLAWLVNTLCSAVVGVVWGIAVMAVVHPLLKALPLGKGKGGHEEGDVRAELAGYRPTKRDHDPGH